MATVFHLLNHTTGRARSHTSSAVPKILMVVAITTVLILAFHFAPLWDTP